MSRPKSIIFPAAGLHRAFAYQAQPPYTCADALNVRTIGTESARARGGSRPGMLKAHTQQSINDNWNGAPQNLNTVRPAAGLNEVEFSDHFDGLVVGSPLYTPPWSYCSTSMRVIGASYVGLPVGPYLEALALINPYISFDKTQQYKVGILMAPVGSQYVPSTRHIFIRCPVINAAMIPNKGTRITLEITSGLSYTLTARDYVTAVSSSISTYSGTLPGHQPVWVEAVVVNNSTYHVYVNNALVLTKTFGTNTEGGNCVGFGVEPVFGTGYNAIDQFNFNYRLQTKNLDLAKSYLTCLSLGSLYREEPNRLSMNRCAHENSIINGYSTIETTEWGGRLWIADHSHVLNSSPNGTISNSAGGDGRILSVLGKTFNGSGINVTRDTVVIKNTGFNGRVTPGCYSIAEVASNYIRLGNDFSAVDDSGIEFEVRSSAKVYNPLTDRLTQWFAPVPCPLITTYRDRIVLAGYPPHVFYMSRAGDPNDFNFGADPNDPGRAIGGTTGEAGKIGKPITALASFADDFLLVGCENELWVIHGDLALGGVMLSLSNEVGIIGPRAWCRTPSGSIVFMSNNGIYQLAPGGGNRPQKLSDRIPKELRTYSPSVTLAWDSTGATPSTYGIQIFTGYEFPVAGERLMPNGWYYDIKNDAFWPFYCDYHRYPNAMCQHSIVNKPGLSLALAFSDGYIRHFSDSASLDDGVPYPSRVLLGPFKEGSTLLDSIFDKMIAVVGENSGQVEWRIYSGPSAESAYDKYLAGTHSRQGCWLPGRNKIDIPRVRGVAHYLEIKHREPPGTRWELDEIIGFFEVKDIYRPL